MSSSIPAFPLDSAAFEPLPSAVPGITVYRPRPQEKPNQDAPRTFTCPQCGAATQYDITAGGVACEHCGFTAQADAKQVGRRAEEFEFTLETLQQAAQGWGIERRELVCEQCGAILSLPEGALTATCPFCASHQVNVRAAAVDVLRPRFLIPFKIQGEALRTAAKNWLGKGWFHPAELASSAIVDHFNGMYLPFWTFDARIAADWKAQLGYERRERYYDQHAKEWRTRVEIDWRWESGHVSLSIDDLLVNGARRVSQVLLERLKPFQLAELVEYAPEFLAGWQAQAYDVTLPQAWEQGKANMREQARSACLQDTHRRSSHVRNFSMTADFADETWRYVLLPVYLAVYQYEGKTFQVMANGQSGAIAGQKPVAWWKIWLAITALLLPGLLLILVGLPLMFLGGAGIIPLGLGAVLLVAGGIFAVQIYRAAVSSEAA